MNNPITVILPFRDASQTIQRAVESILKQSFQYFELLLINDGSTDNSLQLLEQFRDKRIKIITLPPSGIVAALNEGLYSCKTEYIARMDADDYAHPDRLGKQYSFLEDHPEIGVVSSKVRYIGNIDQNYGFFHYVEWNNQLITPEEIYLNRFVESPVTHPSIMMRKEIIKEHGGYAEGDFPEDYEYWLRLMDKGISISKIDEVLLDWHDHENRLSRRHQKYSMDAFYKIKTEYLAKWINDYFRNPPQILVWGTGKSVKDKSRWLEKNDLEIAGYVDVVEKKDHWIEGKPVFHYQNIPSKVFILSYVSNRNGRIRIHDYLTGNGYEEGRDFYMMA